MKPGDWVMVPVRKRGMVTGLLVEFPEWAPHGEFYSRRNGGSGFRRVRANGRYAVVLFNNAKGHLTRGVWRTDRVHAAKGVS